MTPYVIFLGAGASAAEGAPIQRDLFTRYFRGTDRSSISEAVFRDVARFFRLGFGIDVTNLAHATRLPTFEEALGLIDLAINRREGLHGVPLDSTDGDQLDLRLVRRSLVLAMGDAIRQRVHEKPTFHRNLVTNLREQGRLSQTSFVTTNYDTLIDDALYDCALHPGAALSSSPLDYGFDTLSPSPRSTTRDHEHPSFTLLKVHGSLNWLHCPVCTDLVVTHGPDIVARLLRDPDSAKCTRCDAMREPIVVPPTYYKDLSNTYLAVVWNRAARIMRECSHLVFCGYSLPDADMHIKYLVKTGQMNRLTTQDCLKITLVNHHEGKATTDHGHELDRYVRFFGAIVDANASFEEFANAPQIALDV